MTNKKVLVTGASKGIGKSIAKLFAQNGYDVYICARNLETLQKTAITIDNLRFYGKILSNKKEKRNVNQRKI